MQSIDERFEREYNRALRFLSYRPRSEKEIQDFLKRKKVRAQTISKILKKLKEQNLVNDEEFARWWFEQRTSFKPRGLRLIKMELKQKGIDEELIEQVSSIKYQVSSEKELAGKALERKMKIWSRLPKDEFREKAISFLLRRGFEYEAIKNAIDEALEKRYTHLT